MTDIDLSTKFEQISARAKDASEQLMAASERSRDQLRSDAESARDRATAAADRLHDKAAEAGRKASSRWNDIRAQWHAHVAAVKADVNQAEAESAVLDAMYSRARAAVLNSRSRLITP